MKRIIRETSMKTVYENNGFLVLERGDRYVVAKPSQYGMTVTEWQPLTDAGLIDAIDACDCLTAI